MYNTLVSQGNTCTLWCDAICIVNREGTQLSQVIKSLIVKAKGYQKEKESVLQEQKEHDEEVKSELHNKHGDSYTPFQYTLRAEIVDIGTYKIFGQSPTSADVHRKKFYDEVCCKCLIALNPSPTSGDSPSKHADSHSKYIYEMRKLHSVYELDALTESEFKEQKELILSQEVHPCIIIQISYSEPMVVIQTFSTDTVLKVVINNHTSIVCMKVAKMLL